jgi:K+-sensing histidine kinase KdpD
MPLDIAMQNAQLKTLTNVYTNYLLCLAVTIATLLTIFSRNQFTVPYIFVICFFDCRTLSIIESQFLAIVHHCLLWSDYDFIFIHHHVDELE